MCHLKQVKVIVVQLLALLVLLPERHDCLIITSVLAGDKKFKTISFDSKFLKPLMFEKEMPSTEFRRHRTVRPPKFDIDVNIPIKLPLEDEYATEEVKKPVTSNIFFETGEIVEPSYGKKPKSYSKKKSLYSEEVPYAAATGDINQSTSDSEQILDQNRETDQTFGERAHQIDTGSRADAKETPNSQILKAQETSDAGSYSERNYGQQSYQSNGADYQQEFIPGGFVNLQLSGPKGGPKPTYEDYDRERWAQQLSQTAGAMPYPILNYQQLQNFYGGLGTFTNGLAENRYAPVGLLDKLKSGLAHFTNKFHLGN